MVDKLFTVEDLNSTNLSYGASVMHHKIDTSSISDGEYSNVKIDFAVCGHTFVQYSETVTLHEYTFQIDNVNWSGRFYLTDENDNPFIHTNYVYSDAPTVRGGVLTIRGICYEGCDDNYESINLYVLINALTNNTFLVQHETKFPTSSSVYYWNLNQLGGSIDIYYYDISGEEIVHRTQTITSFGPTYSLDVNGNVLVYLVKSDFVFDCSDTATVGRVNQIQLGTGSGYLPNGEMVYNENEPTLDGDLNMTVTYNGTDYPVYYDSDVGDYCFDLDLTSKTIANTVKLQLNVNENDVVNGGVFDFTVETEYSTIDTYQEFIDAVNNETAIIRLGADINITSDITITSDTKILGYMQGFNLNNHSFILSDGVSLRCEDVAFNVGDPAIIQIENSTLELNNCTFVNCQSSDYNNLGSCVFCDIDLESLQIPNDFTTIVEDCKFYNNHNVIFHGGNLTVNNCLYVNYNLNYADKNNSAFLYQVDGQASITNSTFEIKYTDTSLCDNQQSIGFAQALIKCGETATINNATSTNLVEDNRLPFFDEWNNKSHIFVGYYYPSIETCVYTSPMLNYEARSVCYCVTGSDWVFKQNTQVTRADASTENTYDKLRITEHFDLDVGTGVVGIGDTLPITAEHYLLFGNERIELSGSVVEFYDTYDATSLTISGDTNIIQTGSDAHIYAVLKDSDGSLVRNATIKYYKEIEDISGLTLTVDNPILSYLDGDTATLTATTTPATSGYSVKFYDGDGNLLDNVTTDSDGEATYTYTSTGSGETLEFYAVCDEITTSTVTVEDCIKYYSTDLTSDTLINFTLPDSYQIIWDTNRTGSGGSFIRIGNENNNALAIGTIASSGLSGLWEMVNGSWTHQESNGTVSNGTHTYNITVDGTSITFTLDSTTTTITASESINLNNLLGYYVGSTNAMQNFKIKPLMEE